MRFVARQPIFDSRQHVFGYELLFRNGFENCCPAGTDTNAASLLTLDSSLLIGLESLCNRSFAFLNCTRQLLLSEYLTVLPKDRVIFEVLEGEIADTELVEGCRNLKSAGYRLALDDFDDAPQMQPLTALADIIKVDFLLTNHEQRRNLVHKYARTGIKMLAEKVESQQDFCNASTMGYEYFQGYFFCRPEVIATHTIPRNQANCIRLIAAANESPLDFTHIEQIIKSEPSISYRLLRFLNSAAFFFDGEVRSIHQALVLLGEKPLRKWLMVATVADVGSCKPHELVLSSLIRARFEELIGQAAGGCGADAFLVGLLSRMEAILEVPLETVLSNVPVSTDIKQALRGDAGKLSCIHELVVSYEKGDWPECVQQAHAAHVNADWISDFYLEAVEWAERAIKS